MPSAIRHDQEFSKNGLVTILVEVQGSDHENLEAFLWKTFPDNECFTCVGVPVPLPDSPGIPHAGVIGVDGTLLWAGNPLSATKQIDELIAAELDKVKKGWGTSAEAKKVRAALYGKGDLAGALAAVGSLPEGEERTALQGEIDRRYAALKKAVTTLMEQGNWLDAKDAVAALQKGIGTGTQWTSEVATLVTEFDSEAGKAELALDKKLQKIVKQLRDKKRDPAAKALAGLLKTTGSTKVGGRAQRLQKALEAAAALKN